MLQNAPLSAILFDLHKAMISLETQFSRFESAHFTQVYCTSFVGFCYFKG